jgi:SAM-dependent methyltransferase
MLLSGDQPGPARRAWRWWLGASLRARYVVGYYVDAVVPRRQVAGALRALPRFLRERRTYEQLSGQRLAVTDDYPQLLDRTQASPFDPHYTYQDAWAAREIHCRSPARHVDVGSRITFVVGLTAFMPVTFIDVRPLDAAMPNLEPRTGSVLDLPFEDRSVESLSCLHVAEHIGLGRYGDPLDPAGTRKAALELQRVLAPGGHLYFAVPVGAPRTQFNAHRVLDPLEVPRMFPELTLGAFSGVDDDGRWHPELEPADLAGSRWGCGFYLFTRDAASGEPA